MQSKHPTISFIAADYIARRQRIDPTVAATVLTAGHEIQP